ncbi:hypothetical protein R1flu_027622 [Riccia fluitans]|uniref:Uncharacterized protein n=1 Tax=Riccia fluitans TaxID=41844 RepID=A0ABD1XJD6_9MARC
MKRGREMEREFVVSGKNCRWMFVLPPALAVVFVYPTGGFVCPSVTALGRQVVPQEIDCRHLRLFFVFVDLDRVALVSWIVGWLRKEILFC